MPELIQLSSNAAAIARQVKEFPPAMAEKIRQAMDDENNLTTTYAQVNKLSRRGATTLGVVTNRLRLSVHPEPATVTGNTIESAIGSNVRYAGAHEFGFDGTVQVKSHTRHNRHADVFSTSVPITSFIAQVSMHSGRIRKSKPTLISSGLSIVKAHSMHMKMPERSFIRSSIAERTKNYSASISAAIVSAWTPEGGTP